MNEQSENKIINNRVDLTNYITIEKHKSKVNELIAQSKESTQK